MRVKTFHFRFGGADMNAGYVGKNRPGESIPQIIENEINAWLKKNSKIELQRFEHTVATFKDDCIMQIYIFYGNAA